MLRLLRAYRVVRCQSVAMGYHLAIVRLKKGLRSALPLTFDESVQSPIAGPFDHFTRLRLQHAIEGFPFASRVQGGVPDSFEIEPPGGGRVQVLLTRDGHLFIESQAGLELTLSLYLELSVAFSDLAIEDPQTGELHDDKSFKRFLQAEVTAEQPAPEYSEENVA